MKSNFYYHSSDLKMNFYCIAFNGISFLCLIFNLTSPLHLLFFFTFSYLLIKSFHSFFARKKESIERIILKDYKIAFLSALNLSFFTLSYLDWFKFSSIGIVYLVLICLSKFFIQNLTLLNEEFQKILRKEKNRKKLPLPIKLTLISTPLSFLILSTFCFHPFTLHSLIQFIILIFNWLLILKYFIYIHHLQYPF